MFWPKDWTSLSSHSVIHNQRLDQRLIDRIDIFPPEGFPLALPAKTHA
jgi:hypothetical protein